MRKQIVVILVALLALTGAACDFLNITQSTVIDNSSGGTSASDLPSGCIVSQINVDSESGSSVKVGQTITFSAEPQTSTGARLPDTCLNGPVKAEAIGECVLASTSAPALEGTEFYANAPGECKAKFSYGGKSGTSEAVTVTP